MARKDGMEDAPESSADADQYPHFCSFCKKSQRDVRKMIAGSESNAIICDECVQVCVGVLAEEDSADSENEAIEIGLECMEIGNAQLKKSLNYYTDAARLRICRLKGPRDTN